MFFCLDMVPLMVFLFEKYGSNHEERNTLSFFHHLRNE